MRQEERFNDILNECLDRILEGGSVEQCLQNYPEEARELEPLLRTAKTARIISNIQPRPEFKIEARRQFQSALIAAKVSKNERKYQPGHRWHWRWKSGWAVSLVAVVVLILGGGGTIAAAGNSMPDNGLYNVKLATEKVQLALAPGELSKTELNAKFADRRTDEMIYLATKGDVEEVRIVASRLNSNLSNITELAAGDAELDSVSTGEPVPLMAPVPEAIPESAPQPRFNLASAPQPEAAPDLAFSSTADNQTPIAAPSPGRDAAPIPQGAQLSKSAASPATPSAVSPAGENDAIENAANIQSNDREAVKKVSKMPTSKYEKMRNIIQKSYEKRKLKLEEALKSSSEEIRPAIRQAIDQSELEYVRASQNLENN